MNVITYVAMSIIKHELLNRLRSNVLLSIKIKVKHELLNRLRSNVLLTFICICLQNPNFQCLHNQDISS